MLKQTRAEIIQGRCDRCGNDLKQMVSKPVDKNPGTWNHNFGILRPYFGYPSKFDDVGSFRQRREDELDLHLCESCWGKMLKYMGLFKKLYPKHET